MLDVVAAVNDEEVLGRNLLKSPLLRSCEVTLHMRRSYPSAAQAYNAALRRCQSDVVVFVHQDVYLPAHWERKLAQHIASLDASDPDWAVLGVYGVMPGDRQIGCVWSSGLDSLFGQPFADPVRVDSIDELLIVLRRSSGLSFDEDLPGYHLYGTDLVQSALARNQGAYVICAPVVHNSRPSLYLGSDFFRAYRHVARKWRHRLPIRSCVGPVMGAGLSYLKLRARHKFNEFRYAHLDRRSLDRRYDCVGLAKQLGFE